MAESSRLTHPQLKTPKAAAIAGIAFSLLLLLILWLLRTSIPADPLEPGAWLATDKTAITVALNLVPIKMAAVFMISTSTVVIRTGIAPRWIAFLGFLLALILLIGSFFISWSVAVFPSWVFLISVYILIDDLRGNPPADGGLTKP